MNGRTVNDLAVGVSSNDLFKGTVIAYLKVLSHTFLEGLRKK
jgi:hypothetical protein